MTHRLALRALALVALASGAAAQARQGSIYDPDVGPIGLISNKTARKVGDIITVVIDEEQDVSNQSSTDLSRQTNLNYKLNLFDIKPNAFQPLPKVDADSTDGFLGNASSERSGSFRARLAAVVMDTLPNGNLVIAGRREIRVDEDVKLVEFTGIVRRYDVGADNSVTSELVANAEINYQTSGPMARHSQRYGLGGWFHRLWAWVWPF